MQLNRNPYGGVQGAQQGQQNPYAMQYAQQMRMNQNNGVAQANKAPVLTIEEQKLAITIDEFVRALKDKNAFESIRDGHEIFGAKSKVINLKLKLSQKPFLAKIVISEKHPQVPPRLFLRQKVRPPNPQIANDTWEINYMWSIIRDNIQNQRLIDIVTEVEKFFAKSLLECDDKVEEMEQFIRDLRESDILSELMFKNLEQMLPDISPQEYSRYENANLNMLTDQVLKLHEFKRYAEIIIQVINKNKEYGELLKQRHRDIEQFKSTVLEKSQELEIKQGELMALQQQCNMIKERFDKANLLSFIDQRREDLNRETFALETGQGNANLDQRPFQTKFEEFYQKRKLQHKYQILEEKLNETE